MPTIRLIPSAYTRSSTSRVTVTNEANMYNNTDHTGSYASLRGRSGNTTTYYVFIHGFNFSDVPSGVTVNNFSVKIKAYRNSNQSTGSSYRLRLASTPSNNSVISNTTISEDLGTETGGTVYTIPNGSLTWSQLTGYSGFSIEVPLRATGTSASYPYVYVYGAEIEVNYTNPVYYNLTITNNSASVTTDPTGTTSVLSGNSQEISFYTNSINNISITDNGATVTPSAVSGGTLNLIPSEYTEGNFRTAPTNTENALNGTASTTSYATFVGGSRTVYYGIYTFAGISIPSQATITSITCNVRGAKYSNYNWNLALCTGTTHNSGTTDEISSRVTVSTTSSTSTDPGANGIDTITATSLPNVSSISLKIVNETGSSSSKYWIYGAELTIVYSVSNVFYVYTISNISADHTIVISEASSNKMYTKVNDGWVELHKVHKKVNGLWVEQTDLTNVFESGKIYIRDL